MLTDKQISEIRKLLEESQNPLIFFDNDSDGLASFLLLRRYLGRGKGVVIKSFPDLNESYTRKINELNPDVVFVLDKPLISEKFLEFLEQHSLPLIWIDHHPVQEINSPLIYYFNPLSNKPESNEPTSYWCYKITNKKEDIWIAMIGCIGDWFLPDFLGEFEKLYPDLIDLKTKNSAQVLYETKIGKLANILSFALKDRTSNIVNMLKILSNIKSVYELFEEDKDKTKKIYKRYKQINAKYSALLEKAKSLVKNSKKLFLFKYSGDLSISGELSNELFYLFSPKVIAVAYIKGEEAKISLRAKSNIRDIAVKVAEELGGRGGGHEQACAVSVPVSELSKFKEKVEGLI
ncbi:DHH family phosphoesterase [Candidatus Pacearchaeota archaeon]|nr:DHH family phosphoesterase [Candidatus Pacearchaeota archaeon]